MTANEFAPRPYFFRLLLTSAMLGPLSLSLSGCGASQRVPNEDLMSGTAVGETRCSAEHVQERPFVVEWDATDLATFEALSERDVVVVRYENCELTVLDGCSDPSLSGKFGVYLPPRWTSGGLESFDVKTESDLYAKLPLGAASLGAEVRAGQSLHLEYFVSGTARSDRAAVYGDELSTNPHCAGATHFVSSFNLGAFELRSSAHAGGGATAGSSVSEVGVGGDHDTKQKKLKRAGKLASCESDKATDLRSCRVPIRLGLRAVTPGAPPVTPATEGTSRPEVAPTATSVAAGIQAKDDATALRRSAGEKSKMGDGKGCLSDLERAKELSPSTVKTSVHPMLSATCLMQSGECKAGRRAYREFLENVPGGRRFTEVELDRAVEGSSSKHCPADQQTPRERIGSIATEVREAKKAKSPGRCAALGKELAQIVETLPQRSEDDRLRRMTGVSDISHAVDCLARAGDCTTAKALWLRQTRAMYPDDEMFERQKKGFSRRVRECAEE